MAVRRTEEKNNEKAPFIENSRMLIPVRSVSETFGANVIWNSKESTIQITK